MSSPSTAISSSEAPHHRPPPALPINFSRSAVLPPLPTNLVPSSGLTSAVAPIIDFGRPPQPTSSTSTAISFSEAPRHRPPPALPINFSRSAVPYKQPPPPPPPPIDFSRPAPSHNHPNFPRSSPTFPSHPSSLVYHPLGSTHSPLRSAPTPPPTESGSQNVHLSGEFFIVLENS